MGKFEGEGRKLRYVNGLVDELRVGLDCLSYSQFLGILKIVGYKNISKNFYLSPGRSLYKRLRLIS